MFTVFKILKDGPQNCIIMSSITTEAAMMEKEALSGGYDVDSVVSKYITKVSRMI